MSRERQREKLIAQRELGHAQPTPGLTTTEWLEGLKSASKTFSRRFSVDNLRLYSSNVGDARDVEAHETLTPTELMEVVHEAASFDGLGGIAMSIPSAHDGDSFEAGFSDVCDALTIDLDDLLALSEARDSKGSAVERLLARANELAAAKGRPKRVYVVNGVEEVLGRLHEEAFVLLLSPHEFDALVATRVKGVPVLLAHAPS